MFARRILALIATTVAACTGGTGPAAPLTGCWVQSGVDTYAELSLVQHAAAVTGTFSLCGALSGCPLQYGVGGEVLYPHVVLQWTEQNGARYDVTFDATVTPDGDTLKGTMAVNGQPPGPTNYFGRRPACH